MNMSRVIFNGYSFSIHTERQELVYYCLLQFRAFGKKKKKKGILVHCQISDFVL